MQDQFFYFYLTVVISCLIAAMIMPRIWPLKNIPDEYAKEVSEEARMNSYQKANSIKIWF